MPIPLIQTRQKGPKGAASIQVTDSMVTVTFEADGSTLSFLRSDPEAMGFDPAKLPIQSGRVFAEVSGDKKRLFAVRPMVGTFWARFMGIAHSDDQLPSPRRYEGIGTKKDGTTYPYKYEAFTALIEIQSGDWKGYVYPAQLRYLFVDAGDGQHAGIRTGGKHAQHLANFLENAGFDFSVDTLPLSDNMLPWLEAELQSRNETFMIVVNDGYIQSFAPAPSV